jgi:hypothetical protein
MPTLTRRRDRDHPHERWRVYYGDVRVGWIGLRSGNPTNTDPWDWHCGFYPGSEPGECTSGTAATFWEARSAFEAAWRIFLAQRTEADFEAWRRDRESRAEIRAIHARGETLPSEIPSSLMRCVCGVTFDSHKPAESYDHRVHISAVRDVRPR